MVVASPGSAPAAWADAASARAATISARPSAVGATGTGFCTGAGAPSGGGVSRSQPVSSRAASMADAIVMELGLHPIRLSIHGLAPERRGGS